MPILITLGALLGLLGVGGYFGSSPGIGEHPAWRKMSRTPEQYGLRSTVVSFPSIDGIPLKAWWLPVQPPPAAATGSAPIAAASESDDSQAPSTPAINIILAHGQDENRSGMLPRAAFLVHNGYNVLDLDLRDHGESGGHYTTPGYREALDLLGGVAYLRQQGEHGPIVVFGFSYGAVAALHATAQCADISAVIADSAFITPDDVLKNVAHHKGIPLKFKIGITLARLPLFARSADLAFRLRSGVKLDRNKASALPALDRIHDQPLLLISGDKDWVAPTKNVRLMYQRSSATHKYLLVVPGAGHGSTYRVAPELYQSTVLNFLAQNVQRTDGPPRTCQPDPF